MAATQEIFYKLSSKGRLEVLTTAIIEGLDNGQDIETLDDWYAEAKVESARLTGERALAESRETVVIDSLEVPSAYSALVRQIEGVTAEQITEIASLFDSEADFTGAMDAMMVGETLDPRLALLSAQWQEVIPRRDLHGIKEGSAPEAQLSPRENSTLPNFAKAPVSGSFCLGQ